MRWLLLLVLFAALSLQVDLPESIHILPHEEFPLVVYVRNDTNSSVSLEISVDSDISVTPNTRSVYLSSGARKRVWFWVEGGEGDHYLVLDINGEEYPVDVYVEDRRCRRVSPEISVEEGYAGEEVHVEACLRNRKDDGEFHVEVWDETGYFYEDEWEIEEDDRECHSYTVEAPLGETKFHMEGVAVFRDEMCRFEGDKTVVFEEKDCSCSIKGKDKVEIDPGSRRYSFTVKNEGNARCTYRFGGESFSLSPGSSRTISVELPWKDRPYTYTLSVEGDGSCSLSLRVSPRLDVSYEAWIPSSSTGDRTYGYVKNTGNVENKFCIHSDLPVSPSCFTLEPGEKQVFEVTLSPGTHELFVLPERGEGKVLRIEVKKEIGEEGRIELLSYPRVLEEKDPLLFSVTLKNTYPVEKEVRVEVSGRGTLLTLAPGEERTLILELKPPLPSRAILSVSWDGGRTVREIKVARGGIEGVMTGLAAFAEKHWPAISLGLVIIAAALGFRIVTG